MNNQNNGYNPYNQNGTNQYGNVPPQQAPYGNVPPQQPQYGNVPPQQNPYGNMPPQNPPYQQGYYQGNPMQNRQYGYQPNGYYPPQMRTPYPNINPHTEEKREIRKIGNILGLTITAYLVIQVVVSMFLTMSKSMYNKYNTDSIFFGAFNLIFVTIFAVAVPFGVMAIINKKKYAYPIIPTKKIPFSKVILWTGFGMGCCLATQILVSGIIKVVNHLGYDLVSGNSPDVASPLGCVILVISTAIAPAIAEELAMRCCSMQLVRKYGKALSVVSISIVFGLLHGNVLQFIFATIVGLILGFVTLKTDNIIPAMLIHCFNNLLSVTSDVAQYFTNEKTTEHILLGVYLFWIVVFIISVVLLAVKGDLNGKKKMTVYDYIEQQNNGTYEQNQPKEQELSFGSKLFSIFFVPGMILPILYLVISTLTTIKPI